MSESPSQKRYLVIEYAEAMPEGGTVHIRAAKSAHGAGGAGGAEIIVAVRDTGPGISGDNLANIFRPFFTTKNKKGMGLGLSI